MKNLFLIILLFPLFFSCNFSAKKNTSRLLPELDILERLKRQKSEIDTLYKYHRCNILSFAQLTENSLPFRIDSTFDEEYYTKFVLQKDSMGKIISASEFPYCRSGDWFLVVTHYFDKNGQTFVYERQFNTFHCLDGIGYETITKYYNADFQIINKEYKLVDENGKPISKDCCMIIDYDDIVSQNINKYLKFNKIKK